MFMNGPSGSNGRHFVPPCSAVRVIYFGVRIRLGTILGRYVYCMYIYVCMYIYFSDMDTKCIQLHNANENN